MGQTTTMPRHELRDVVSTLWGKVLCLRHHGCNTVTCNRLLHDVLLRNLLSGLRPAGRSTESKRMLLLSHHF